VFSQKQYSKVEPFKTVKKGWGLRAMQPLSAGSFIMEYVGEVLGPKDFRSRVKRYAREDHEHHFFMALKADEIIDATTKGNVTRFINHSCDPNAETQKWTVNGELRIGFFTSRNLEMGEEITFDYQFQRYGLVCILI
jgi:histone-lysine N-methyltransferase SETD2